jgi:hypothetical protein
MIVDVMHLVVLIVAVGFGAWSLIAFRTRLPRGRFVIFAAASMGALFACGAVGGEVGLMSQQAWFAAVIAMLVALALGGYAVGRRQPRWR